MPLQLDLSPGDVLRIGTGTTIRVEAKTGNRTRVSIESDYRVVREPQRVKTPAAGQPGPREMGVKRPT